MEPQGVQRKLSAILSADVKGYSRLMGEDEVGTIRTLTAYREIMAVLVRQHRGRVVDSPGDALLAEFASVMDAVQCAVEIQETLKARNDELPGDRRMEFRIGVNLGDVVFEGEQIYGDGVNIAARLEGLAEAGGICISGTVHDSIENKLALGYEYLGEQTVKNIKKPVRVYRVLTEPEAAGSVVYRRRRDDPSHRRRAALTLGVVLVIAVMVVVMWRFFLRPSAPLEKVTFQNTPAPLELPDKPSIAVLPFTNMSGDPNQEYFSDGITEDLITDLSKISGLFVIARNSVFIYKGKTVKVEQVSKDLGVRYLLEGSVRKAGDRVRITAQLVDATTGGHIWAERYDRDLNDIFALQDDVTQKIVTALAVKLTEGERGRLEHKYTDNLEAYDLVLRGMEYYSRLTKEGNAQARERFQDAIHLDPEYAYAKSRLGWTHLAEWFFGWSQDPQSLEKAFELAQEAIAQDDSLPDAYCLLSNVYLWRKQHEQAIAVCERSIHLDPNYADAIAGLGDFLSWAGRPEEGIVEVKTAIRLNPNYPFWYTWSLGHAYFLTRRFEDAIATFKTVLNRNPNFHAARAFLAASYSELSRDDEAQAEVQVILNKSPEISLEVWTQRLPYKDPAVLEWVLGALRKAGLK
jgi:adenylate cyclase